jgi:hypothetical protein
MQSGPNIDEEESQKVRKSGRMLRLEKIITEQETEAVLGRDAPSCAHAAICNSGVAIITAEGE